MAFKTKDLMVNIVPTGKQVGVDCVNCTGTTGLIIIGPKDGLAELKQALAKART